MAKRDPLRQRCFSHPSVKDQDPLVLQKTSWQVGRGAYISTTNSLKNLKSPWQSPTRRMRREWLTRFLYVDAAVGQLPYNTRSYEAKIVASVLRERAQRRRGASAIGDLLPAVLARLNVTEENKCGDGPEPV